MHRALFTVVGVLAALLLANPALSISWLRNCQTGVAVTSIDAGGTACSNPDTTEADTDIIDVRACENVDVFITDDQNGDGTTDAAGTYAVQICPVADSDATTDTDAERASACHTVDANASVDMGTADHLVVQGLGVGSGWIRVAIGGTVTNDPQIWVKCNP